MLPDAHRSQNLRKAFAADASIMLGTFSSFKEIKSVEATKICLVLLEEDSSLFLKFIHLVPGAGLEPARSFLRGILSPLCLPIPPPGLDNMSGILIVFLEFTINIKDYL